jgi:predicted transcriptional regulator
VLPLACGSGLAGDYCKKFPIILVYKQFWIRLSNECYSLDNFDKYEKHFTVMNYKHNDNYEYDSNELNKYKWMQMSDLEFISLFNEQNERRNSLINNMKNQIEIENKNKNKKMEKLYLIENKCNDWESIKKRIYKIIKEFFVFSTYNNNNVLVDKPLTIKHQPNSRAMYGLISFIC